MIKIKNYVKAASLEEAYELNQKKTSKIIGGMMWLKMTNKNYANVIDLSGLGLDQIEETDEEFQIGCMTSLHALEIHKGLNEFTCGAIRESVRHIVGVQFRNCATVGGSIFGRYGFSDVLTIFLALDTYVELYKGGVIPLQEFAAMPKDRDILVRLIVRKTPAACSYMSQRNSETDFPVLTCASSVNGDRTRVVVGARPFPAVIIEDKNNILDGYSEMERDQKKAAAEKFAEYVMETIHTDSNMRGSAEYRKLLAKILVRRTLMQAGGCSGEN